MLKKFSMAMLLVLICQFAFSETWDPSTFTWDAPMLKWDNALRPHGGDAELKKEVLDFYKLWRNGDAENIVISKDMIDADGKANAALKNILDNYGDVASPPTGGLKKLGYIKKFKLPEEHLGSEYGYVVYMYGNGHFESVCASTSEAMGWGMIITALMGDEETFEGLYRVVDYYNANLGFVNDQNQWETKEVDHLTSWIIPAKPGIKVTECDWYQKMSDTAKATWEGSSSNKVLTFPAYEDESKQEVILGAVKSTANCLDTAIDGDLDIAYGLTLARHIFGSKYFKPACDRFAAIFSEDLINGVGRHKHKNTQFPDELYLPTEGVEQTIDWPDLDDTYTFKSSYTRPSDWMLTHFRTYYKFVAAKDATDMVNSIYSHAYTLRHPTSHLLPDFGVWKPATDPNKPDVMMPLLDGMHVDEGNTDDFNYNASRVPMRMGIDYFHFGDERSKELAIGITRSRMQAHSYAKGTDWFTGKEVNGKVVGYPKSGYKLDGSYKKDSDWPSLEFTSPMVLAAATGKGGDDTYTEQDYQNFLNEGWDYITERVYDGSNVVEGSMAKFNGAMYNFEWASGWDRAIAIDSYHSGYYGDSIALMSMLAITGNWVVPEAYKNELKGHNHDVSNGTDGWKVETTGNCQATLSSEGGRLKVTVDQLDATQDVFGISVVRDDIDETSHWNYVLAANIEKVNLEGTKFFDAKLTNTDGSTNAELLEHKKLIVGETPLITGTYQAYTQGFFEKAKGQRYKKLKIGLNTDLNANTVIYLDNFSLTDPPWENARYRYVGIWKENYNYVAGDYVRYNYTTYECTTNHTSENNNNPELTLGENWKKTNYSKSGPDWQSHTAYTEGTIVNYNGRAYVCIMSHYSALDPSKDTAVWMLYADPFKDFKVPWRTGVDYIAGAYVEYNGNIYECVTSHTSLSTWNPEVAHTLWNMNNHPFTVVTPEQWETWTEYPTGFVVEYNNNKYECIAGHTSQPGWTPNAIASLWRPTK